MTVVVRTEALTKRYGTRAAVEHWKASGLDFPKLIEKMVEDALRAHADKNSSVFAYDSSILKKVAAGTKGSKR